MAVKLTKEITELKDLTLQGLGLTQQVLPNHLESEKSSNDQAGLKALSSQFQRTSNLPPLTVIPIEEPRIRFGVGSYTDVWIPLVPSFLWPLTITPLISQTLKETSNAIFGIPSSPSTSAQHQRRVQSSTFQAVRHFKRSREIQELTCVIHITPNKLLFYCAQSTQGNWTPAR